MKESTIQTQLASDGSDGQHCNNYVDTYLTKNLKLDKTSFTWNPTHQLQLAEKGTSDAKEKTRSIHGQETVKHYHAFCNKLINTITDALRNMRFGRKSEHLLQVMEEFPDDKHPHLDTVSSTRFCPYSARILKAFVLNLKPLLWLWRKE